MLNTVGGFDLYILVTTMPEIFSHSIAIVPVASVFRLSRPRLNDLISPVSSLPFLKNTISVLGAAFNGIAQLNTALFRSELENLQVSTIDDVTTTFNVGNAATDKTKNRCNSLFIS